MLSIISEISGETGQPHVLSGCSQDWEEGQLCPSKLTLPHTVFPQYPREGGSMAQDEMKSLSRVQLFVIPWTVAYQAPSSMGFSRQEYWSGLPFPSPGDLPNPGIEPGSPALRADALTSEPPGKP